MRHSIIVATLACAGCYGGYSGNVDEDSGASGMDTEGVADTDTDPADDDDDPSADPEAPSAPDCTDVGPRMVRRLTSSQLRSTLQTIFADPDVPDAQVLTDPVVDGFKVDATESVVRDLGAQQIMQYAETVSNWAVDTKLAQIVPCQSNDDPCREQVVRDLGRTFHREPLDDAMVSAYLELMAGEAGFEDAVREVLSAMIQSPYFLYRREIGVEADDSGRTQLTDYELASNLSYSLVGGPPDAQLMAAAEQGLLSQEAELVAQAERLAQSEAGQHHLTEFLKSWLEIEDLLDRVKVEEGGVVFDEALRSDMLAETDALFLHLFVTGGTTSDLLNSPFTFVNQRLGHFYRMWEANSEDHQQMEIPQMGEGVRAPGILGHGSILARHSSAENSSPVARGVMVRRRLLCQELPDPPADVDTNLQPIEEGSTNRERYEQHTSDPTCASCHSLIDPIGFTFEHYDQFGRWRDQESGQPVDATGALTGLASEEVPLDGLDTLAEALANTDEVQACYAEYLSYYTYGLEGCNPDAIEAAAGANPTLESTLQAIITSPHFRERTAD